MTGVRPEVPPSGYDPASRGVGNPVRRRGLGCRREELVRARQGSRSRVERPRRPPLPGFRVLPQLGPALPVASGAELWCWRGPASLAHLRRRIELRGKGFPDAVATACVGKGRQSLIARTVVCVRAAPGDSGVGKVSRPQ